MKIVINDCYGGFSLSVAAEREFRKRRDVPYYEVPRNDPDLVAVIEMLGKEADGKYAELKVVEIPDDVVWFIDAYAGIETIHEEHRSWG